MSDPHVWMRDRHVASALGLLEDAEHTAYQTHLADCIDCRTGAAAFLRETGERIATDGHVPSAVLVALARRRWAPGITERAALDTHIARCRSCREELAWLEQRAPAAAAARTGPRAGAGPWLTTWAWASTALAAALAIAVFQPRTTHAPAAGAKPAPDAATAIELIGTPETLRTPLRSEAASGVTRVTPGLHGELVLRFEPMDQPADVPMTLLLRGPDGRTLASLACLQRDLELRHTVVLTPRDGVFAPGRYDLAAIAHPANAAPETLTLGFEVTPAR